MEVTGHEEWPITANTKEQSMPDKNKIKVFQSTGMKIFKSCVLCKHGEIPGNVWWGYCKHPEHFFTHARHGRMPGVAHAAMGCDDFELLNKHTREMVELGVYSELIPYYDEEVEMVGVEEEAAEPPIMQFHGDAPPREEDEEEDEDEPEPEPESPVVAQQPELTAPENPEQKTTTPQSARARLRRGEE